MSRKIMNHITKILIGYKPDGQSITYLKTANFLDTAVKLQTVILDEIRIPKRMNLTPQITLAGKLYSRALSGRYGPCTVRYSCIRSFCHTLQISGVLSDRS